MTDRDRIIMALWVERSTSVCRLAALTGTEHDACYLAVYDLCGMGMVVHPAVGVPASAPEVR